MIHTKLRGLLQFIRYCLYGFSRNSLLNPMGYTIIVSFLEGRIFLPLS